MIAEVKVSVIASMTNSKMMLKDNGDGSTILSGVPSELLASPFADAICEGISVQGGFLILWLHRNELLRIKRK